MESYRPVSQNSMGDTDTDSDSVMLDLGHDEVPLLPHGRRRDQLPPLRQPIIPWNSPQFINSIYKRACRNTALATVCFIPGLILIILGFKNTHDFKDGNDIYGTSTEYAYIYFYIMFILYTIYIAINVITFICNLCANLQQRNVMCIFWLNAKIFRIAAMFRGCICIFLIMALVLDTPLQTVITVGCSTTTQIYIPTHIIYIVCETIVSTYSYGILGELIGNIDAIV
jgi:hypothetical protein